MNEYRHLSTEHFSREVLAEIPGQVSAWAKMNRVGHNPALFGQPVMNENSFQNSDFGPAAGYDQKFNKMSLY
jgi:hypothetical protein